jgi:hypothetical protein
MHTPAAQNLPAPHAASFAQPPAQRAPEQAPGQTWERLSGQAPLPTQNEGKRAIPPLQLAAGPQLVSTFG